MQPATHRDQLITMLAEAAEAAEIEHCLMCTYLYAAFLLKQSIDEDLLAHEFSAVQRWRAEIIAIATEEMLLFGHLLPVAKVSCWSAIG